MNSYGFFEQKKKILKNNREYHEICLENKRKIPAKYIKKKTKLFAEILWTAYQLTQLTISKKKEKKRRNEKTKGMQKKPTKTKNCAELAELDKNSNYNYKNIKKKNARTWL